MLPSEAWTSRVKYEKASSHSCKTLVGLDRASLDGAGTCGSGEIRHQKTTIQACVGWNTTCRGWPLKAPVGSNTTRRSKRTPPCTSTRSVEIREMLTRCGLGGRVEYESYSRPFGLGGRVRYDASRVYRPFRSPVRICRVDGICSPRSLFAGAGSVPSAS